jgi:hypothetical protein
LSGSWERWESGGGLRWEWIDGEGVAVMFYKLIRTRGISGHIAGSRHLPPHPGWPGLCQAPARRARAPLSQLLQLLYPDPLVCTSPCPAAFFHQVGLTRLQLTHLNSTTPLPNESPAERSTKRVRADLVGGTRRVWHQPRGSSSSIHLIAHIARCCALYLCWRLL